MTLDTAVDRAPDDDVDTFDSLDPRSGELVGRYPRQDQEAVDRAVADAAIAAAWWRDLGPKGRRARMARWRRYLAARIDLLAEVIASETGKPVGDAKVEVVLGIDHIHWAEKHAHRVLKRRTVLPGMLMSNHHATVEYEPLGVVGVIGPWNYPVFTPMGSIAYALAAGNAVVFKPSEYTPGVGKFLVDAFAEAVPEHPVFSLITGEGATGAALCRADIQKLAFTGSTATGRRVMATCAERLTPVLIECGGKDACIVDADADLAEAADAAVWGAMSNAGQTCVGVERVYVHESVADDLIGRVRDLAAGLATGGTGDDRIGPITMPAQTAVIRRHIEAGIADGGSVALGGVDSVDGGYVSPVVLVDVPEDSAAVTEETFGPVVIINRVASMDDAVERANASDFGLGASVFAGRSARSIADRLRVGMVGINSVMPFVAIPALPFGGVGDSGFGRIHGADGLREFARPKSVARKLMPPMLRPTSFSSPRWTADALVRLARVLYGR